MKHTQAVLVFIFVMGFIAQSCKKENVSNISANNGNESHNMGQNCMNCHSSSGNGRGIFTVAGTVYNTALTSINGNGKVHLFTEANGGGTLKATIEVDDNGNFFTTESVDFSIDLYASITGSSGNTKYMASKITDGQCNGCHGVSVDKIWVE